MSESYKSSPVFIFDLPEIEDMTATFKYHYFTRGESVYPANADQTLDGRERQRFGIPRQVIINLKQSTLENLSVSDDIVKNMFGGHFRQVLSPQNFAKAEPESTLQTTPTSRLAFTSVPKLDEEINNNWQTDEATSDYDSFASVVSNINPKVKELIKEAIEKGDGEANALVFDPTTNLPIVEFDETMGDYESSGMIFNFAIGDVVNSISSNYLSPESLNYVEKTNKAKVLQNSSKDRTETNSFDLSSDQMEVDPINTSSNISTDPGIGLIGIVAFKTRIDGDERVPEKPIVLLSRGKNTIIDNAVVYGAEYEYAIHTLGLCRLRAANNKLVSFLVYSPNGKKITVECIEAKPPPPPTDIRFRFLDSSMLVEWDLPVQTSETGKPINDIKYVQLFKRPSLEEPFQLIAQLDFDDSMVIIPSDETIPLSRVIKTQQSQNFYEVPLPDYDSQDIYAACTVDAHGNSSNYSAQYKAIIDNLKNYAMEHVAYPGAPKQYPNLTFVDDAFVDSIKTSGFSSLEIYHNPKVTTLMSSKNEKIINVSKKGTATNPRLPAYVLQLIDLETQKDQKINIFISEK